MHLVLRAVEICRDIEGKRQAQAHKRWCVAPDSSRQAIHETMHIQKMQESGLSAYLCNERLWASPEWAEWRSLPIMIRRLDPTQACITEGD